MRTAEAAYAWANPIFHQLSSYHLPTPKFPH
jgi:hypothetical protein